MDSAHIRAEAHAGRTVLTGPVCDWDAESCMSTTGPECDWARLTRYDRPSMRLGRGVTYMYNMYMYMYMSTTGPECDWGAEQGCS